MWKSPTPLLSSRVSCLTKPNLVPRLSKILATRLGTTDNMPSSRYRQARFFSKNSGVKKHAARATNNNYLWFVWSHHMFQIQSQNHLKLFQSLIILPKKKKNPVWTCKYFLISRVEWISKDYTGEWFFPKASCGQVSRQTVTEVNLLL